MKRLFETIIKSMDDNVDTVLTSIIESSGSTPGKTGAHMLAGRSGRIYGTVGGGAVEAEALGICLEVLENKRVRTERFGFKDEFSGESVCGGDVTLRFQFISCHDSRIREISERIVESPMENCLLVFGPVETEYDSLYLYPPTNPENAVIPEEVICPLASKAGTINYNGYRYYTQPLLKKGRVYIFGGGHIAQALAPVLSKIGFRFVVIEDRPEFCRSGLFPGAEEILLLEPENWGSRLRITPDDYICIMTRGHKNDIDCECFALKTEAKYIGVLGSKRKIKLVNRELIQRGFSENDISRIITPIGIDISAETPDELAISIAAQLIQIRNS